MKANIPFVWPKLLLGRIRLFFHSCPWCNSDAPEVDRCEVCNSWASKNWLLHPPPPEVLEAWWRRFKRKIKG